MILVSDVTFNKLETINTIREKTKKSKAWVLTQLLPKLKLKGIINEYTFKRKKIIYFKRECKLSDITRD